jgi:uncharacterized membrane protein (UPF0182 family)
MSEDENAFSGTGKKILLVAGALIGLLIVGVLIFEYISGKLFNYYWFQSVGLEAVYLRNLKWEFGMFFAGAILTLVLFAINWFGIKSWKTKRAEESTMGGGLASLYLIVAFVVALILGAMNATNYFDIFRYLNQTPYNVFDPIWHNDISLYVFTLPVVQEILDLIMANLLVILVVDAFIFNVNAEAGVIDMKRLPWNMRISFSLFMLAMASKIFLYRYDVLNHETEHIAGAGINDLFAIINMCHIVALLFVFVGLLALVDFMMIPLLGKQDANIKYGIIVAALVVVLILFKFGTPIISYADYRLGGIASNEQDMQTPYMEHSINYTRQAYSIDGIVEKPYPNNVELDASIKSSASVDNARVFDWRQMVPFLQKDQTLQRCYKIGDDVDVDRYNISGKERQVIIATRQLNYELIPSGYPSKHMIFTHAIGPIVTSVNEMGAAGDPLMYSSGIPPHTDIPELQVENHGVWYGEGQDEYVFTNTATPELDYPLNETNKYMVYDGSGGIPVGSYFRKLIMADNLDDRINILLSDAINYDSRLHIHRNVDERINMIVPYLYLDGDSSLFIDSAKKDQAWMVSALAYDDKYPYSARSQLGGKEVNYVRDSVKVVVDSVSGNMTFYIVNKDPLIETYRKMYQEVFRDISEMPESQRSHIKYSEDLFNVQTGMLNIYHMTNVSQYYSKDDQYQFSLEQSDDGGQEVAIPYSAVLEDRNGTSFVLMRTFKPGSGTATNLAAWISVNQDWPGYGKMLLYTFNKGNYISGPAQIESSISQDDAMSTQIGQWSRTSTVIRGNLLVIPVNGGIINIEPIYIAAANNPMPKLVRVVVYYENAVTKKNTLVWAETLDSALDLAFGKGGSPVNGTAQQNLQQQLGSGADGAMKILVFNSDGSLKQTIVLQGDESFTVKTITQSAGNNSTAA